MHVRQFVLEYATERAGDLLELSAPELGLGVVNPRIELVESVDDVKRAIERALKIYQPERLFVNPDCGFATFSNRPVNSSDIAAKKMKTIAEAVKAFR
jgi:5-methyltetrahydropteroyltriglutamate--homocysteine methyltransferase